MKTQILKLQTEIEVNVKAIASIKEDLKLINGDTVTANKIEKLLSTLPTETDNGEQTPADQIKFLCEQIRVISKEDISLNEAEIEGLKSVNKLKNIEVRKLERLQKQVDEAMGVETQESIPDATPEVEAIKGE